MAAQTSDTTIRTGAAMAPVRPNGPRAGRVSAVLCAALVLAGCARSRTDAALRGVPLPEALRPALEASRRSLAAGDRGDPAVRATLDRYDRLAAMLADPSRRAAGEDSLYRTWLGDLRGVLWPELVATNRNQIRDRARFRAVFADPAFPDSASGLGAYLREWGPRGAGAPVDTLARAPDPERATFGDVWIALRRARRLRLAGRGADAARLALDCLPAARRVGGWRLEGEDWAQVGLARAAAGDLDGALHADAMAEALVLAASRGTGTRHAVLDARFQRAQVLAARRDVPQALALYEACTNEALAAGESNFAAMVQNHAGILDAAVGRHEAAIAAYRRALTLALAAGDSLLLPRYLANIAQRHRELGNLDSCRFYLDETERWIRAFPDPASLQRFPLIQAEYFARIGDYDAVDSLHAIAARRTPASAPISGIAELHLQIIKQAAERGRPAQAYRSIALLDSLRGRLGSTYADRNELFDLDVATADFLGLQGQFARAGEALDSAQAALSRRPDPLRAWELSGARGHLARRRNDPAAAETAYRACLEMGEARHDDDRAARGRVWLAALLLEQGRLEAVRRLLPREPDAAFGSRYRTRVSALLLRAMADSRAGRFEAALRALERLSSLRRPGSPPDLLARLDLETGRALSGLHRGDEARRAYDRTGAVVLGERRAFATGDAVFLDSDLRRELAEAMLDLATDAAGGILEGPPAGAALRRVEALLPAWHRAGESPAQWLAEPQLVYFVGSGASYRWTLAGGRLTLRRLPGRAALLAAMAPALADALEPSRPLAAGALDALTNALGGAVPAWPADSELTIVPDGPLFAVPWAALARGGAARGSWIEKGPIVVADAPACAGHGTAHPPRGRLLAVGVDGGARVRAVGLAPLRHAEREAREVGALWPKGLATLRVGRQADWRALAAAGLSGFEAIHVASHALLYRGRADQTTLLLAGSPGEPLTAAEIAKLRLRAELVFLSCCEAAEDDRGWAGPAYAGLAGSFLAAGASNVVAPSVRVEDEAARRFADRFYRHWLEGRTVAGALRATQLELRGGDARWAHPYHWAFYQVIRGCSGAAPARLPSRRSGGR